MTTPERIARLTTFAGRIRGVDRCIDNARHAQGWREDHPDVAYWLDSGECYAGIITPEELNARHTV